MRKRAVSLILCLCMVLSLVPVPVLAQNVENDNPFSDVEESDWFYDGVQYVFEHELMKGTNSTIFETLFEPERATQRGMIVTILYRLDGSPPVTDTCPFEDVPRGSNYENAIIWAASNGIVTGYTNTSFGPYDDITRQQMAAILYRYANVKHYDVTEQSNLNVFTDSGRISNYARVPLSWANAKELINGITPTILAPTEKVTRAQSAVILTRFCENIVPGDVTPPSSEPATYAVTFNLNYSAAGTSQIINVTEGQTVPKPANPKRTGYTFDGWYTDAKKGDLFDFTTIIDADITLYARWHSHSSNSNHSSSSGNATSYYTVTFDTRGGSVIPSQSIAYGNTVTPPSNPTKADYTFEGWYSDSELNAPYNFMSAVTGNIIIYAKWTPTDISSQTFSVTFETNGGSAIEPQMVQGGNKAQRPDMPQMEGHFFNGWYSDVELSSLFDFETTQIQRNTILYAGWIDFDQQMNQDNDNDELSDALEILLGTDTTLDDTDGDGLSDYEEIMLSFTNPLEVDTDNDGLNDGQEDNDEDGLSNLEEIALNTNLNLSDTDLDGLSDYDEIHRYGTNPLEEDTDNDGVSDGDEIALGTDPLTFNSTFDVTRSAVEEDTVSVSVEATLSGEQVGSLSVTKVESISLFPEDMPGYIGGAYDFIVDGNIDSATISFTFDNALLSDEEFDPVIYYFNAEEQTLEELDTAVHGNVASSQITHFSKYILLNRAMFENAFNWIDVWDANNYTGIEIIFVVDDSGSMKDNDSNYARLSVAKQLIDSLPNNSKIGVVKFTSGTEKLTTTLTANKEDAKNYLSRTYFSSSGGTNMYTAIGNSFDLFQYENENTLRIIVVLSDGESSSSDTSLHNQVVAQAQGNNVKVYSVGLGRSEQYFNNFLKPLAEGTGGKFYLTEQADGLTEIYDDIKEKLDMETDSDNDGIPDYFEDNFTLFNGTEMSLDKNNPDTDGDGLSDGEEVEGFNYRYNEDESEMVVTIKIKSNPNLSDSDDDGLLDNEAHIIKINGEEICIAPKDSDPLIYNGLPNMWKNHIKRQRNGPIPIARNYDLSGQEDEIELVKTLKSGNFMHRWLADCIIQGLVFVRDIIARTVPHYHEGTESVKAEIKNASRTLRTLYRLCLNLLGDDGDNFLSQAGAYLLNFVPDEYDIAYHSQRDTWQRLAGFNNFYDEVFGTFTDADCKPIIFYPYDSSTGRDSEQAYALWMWKGDYWNMESGAEIGVYVSTGLPSLDIKHYTTIKLGDELPMNLSLYNYYGSAESDIRNVFNWYPHEPQWWITGFNVRAINPNPKVMVLVGSVNFSDEPTLYAGLKKGLMTNNSPDLPLFVFDDEHYTAWVMWI